MVPIKVTHFSITTIVEDIIQNQRHQSTTFIESHYLFLEVTCFISKTTEYVDLSRKKIFPPNTALTEETKPLMTTIFLKT